MKMTLGSGTIANYGLHTKGCTLRQYPYKIPINSLADVQLYIDIGTSGPGSASYELIHTCGPSAGSIDAITPVTYVIGQDTNDRYYGVFVGFTGSTPISFVIAITLGSDIYFSEEYLIESSSCTNPPTFIQGCYGNLDPLISYDCEGLYFGVSQGSTLGNAALVYKHQMLLRNVEVTLSAMKNTFKQGRTRNFRTEKEKIFQFWAEPVPEWYVPDIDAVFYRGEVFIGGTKYLVNDTSYEKVEECLKIWKLSVTLKETCLQSFSCEPDPCATPDVESGGGGPVDSCCIPVIINATVQNVADHLNTVTITFLPCTPTPSGGYTVVWRVAGSSDSYTPAGPFTGSPAIFTDATHASGTLYEGFIRSDCGDGILGDQVAWVTLEPESGTDVFFFTGSGRGSSSSIACADWSANNRTFYSDCSSIAPGCTVYTDHNGLHPLVGYPKIYMDGANWDVNTGSGVIIGLSAIQC